MAEQTEYEYYSESEAEVAQPIVKTNQTWTNIQTVKAVAPKEESEYEEIEEEYEDEVD